jgi:outer membrane protein OmpA-like peptidoglycan-associated protein
MKKIIIIIMGLIISIAFVGTGIAQAKAVVPEIGRRVIITGCLHRGTSLDSFVLLGVTERSADASEPDIPMPYAIYWLDSTKGFDTLVGKMVEVTGKITSKETKPGTITIAINPDDGLSTDVQVKSGKRDITSKKFDYSDRPEATADSQSTLIMPRPVYNLAVDDINPVDTGSDGPPCQFEEKVIIPMTEMSEPKTEEKVKILATDAKDEEKIIILAFEDVNFGFDKSTLTKKAQEILKRNIKLLIDNPNTKVRIAGYTSAAGTEEYNEKLSERRAKSVEGYLVKEGLVSPERLSTIGYGETNPADYEAAPLSIYSKEAKANMRVLFEIVVK